MAATHIIKYFNMRIPFIIILVFLFVFESYGQKEVFFEEENKQISVQTLQGLELSYSSPMIKRVNFLRYDYGSIFISYTHENKLTKSLSLNKSLGLYNDFQALFDESEHLNGLIYNLSLGGLIEPRWYFNNQNRYLSGKSVELNSGWFLSIPITFQFYIAGSPYPGQSNWYFYESIPIICRARLAVGYRHAFSSRFFMEGSLSVGDFSFQRYSSGGSFSQNLYLQFQVKGVYLF